MYERDTQRILQPALGGLRGARDCRRPRVLLLCSNTLLLVLQTATHVCLVTDYCPGGELYYLLEQQPQKRFSEEVVR
jgi:hypothetical protein